MKRISVYNYQFPSALSLLLETGKKRHDNNILMDFRMYTSLSTVELTLTL